MDLLANNVVSILALIFALIILMKNREGWGWFLFAAVMMANIGTENGVTIIDKEGVQSEIRASTHE
jgi:hypothetical protein